MAIKIATMILQNPLINEPQNDTGLSEGSAAASPPPAETAIPAAASPAETVISDGETISVNAVISAAVSRISSAITPAQTLAVIYRLLERNSL